MRILQGKWRKMQHSQSDQVEVGRGGIDELSGGGGVEVVPSFG